MFAAKKPDPEPTPTPVAERDKTRDWRRGEFIRLLGPDGAGDAEEYADSRVDLHAFERAVKAGCSLALLRRVFL
jgi:hypothetical protein